jgi:hypothetical protein
MPSLCRLSLEAIQPIHLSTSKQVFKGIFQKTSTICSNCPKTYIALQQQKGKKLL